MGAEDLIHWTVTAKKYPREFLAMVRKFSEPAKTLTGDESPKILGPFIDRYDRIYRGVFCILDFQIREGSQHIRRFSLLAGIVGQDKMTEEHWCTFEYFKDGPVIVEEGILSTIPPEDGMWFVKQSRDTITVGPYGTLPEKIMANIPVTVKLLGGEFVSEDEAWEKVVGGKLTGQCILIQRRLIDSDRTWGAEVRYIGMSDQYITPEKLFGKYVQVDPGLEEGIIASGRTKYKKESPPDSPAKKYYYASFVKHTDMLDDGRGTSIPTPWNMILDSHPLRSLLEFNKNNGTYKQTPGGMRIRELLELRFYYEIAESEYHEFKDHF